jgi:TlyA family rRNA methyltransferase/putative hemolysin
MPDAAPAESPDSFPMLESPSADRRRMNRRWIIFAVVAATMLAYFLPFLLLGNNSFITIHDTLDGEFVNAYLLVATGKAFTFNGASTGGFTDCLLQRGASHVTAVDTGFGQIAMKLRNDGRVRLVERTNARFLAPGALAEVGQPELTLLVMDVSFISATLLLAPVFGAAPALTEAVILVKPQFEAGRGNVGKGGIVRDPEVHRLAVERVAACITELTWHVEESIPSPITGGEGNVEFLLYAKRG